MINYTLQCEHHHRFESSFRSIADYEKLEKNHALECPRCGSARISRAPMAPAIARSAGDRAEGIPAAGTDESSAQELQKTLQDKFADVGEDFPEEARALHRGDTKARRRYRGKWGLIGQASDAEVNAMQDEGVPVGKVRVPKYDA